MATATRPLPTSLVDVLDDEPEGPVPSPFPVFEVRRQTDERLAHQAHRQDQNSTAANSTDVSTYRQLEIVLVEADRSLIIIAQSNRSSSRPKPGRRSRSCDPCFEVHPGSPHTSLEAYLLFFSLANLFGVIFPRFCFRTAISLE